MIKIRGNRIYFTPASDVDLPEAERRSFALLNPSMRTFDGLMERFSATEGDTQTIRVGDMVHACLRGWTNVTTDDAEVAKKYTGAPSVPEPCDGVMLTFAGASQKNAVDLLDLLSKAEWKTMTDEYWATINPVTSGNFASPASSRPGESADPASGAPGAPASPTSN